jgi:hypothetical protein
MVGIWQADFYRRPLQDQAGKPLWELIICDPAGTVLLEVQCSQSEATASWVTRQLQDLAQSQPLPNQIQVFRPQAVSLLETACQPLGVRIEPTRNTEALKQILRQKAALYPTLPNYSGQPYSPTELEQPPPLPLPETLWGERWQFAAIAATDLVPAFQNRRIPILELPDAYLPMRLNLASTTLIPGVVIEAGRRSMQLARWLQQNKPYALNYIPGDPDGLILEAGLIDRWVLATFSDQEMGTAAHLFRDRQQAAAGLHFLLVQPDDSGMTYSGFWLLKRQD